ncbi:hypothetical protein IWQ62_000960 [Dispira parvispora]|uniref:Uncharacterized protein n=1 Tax=Dispira parvispora TaxID=1520584 RepID=A0A9W8E937_9FUNG|nr:hypothetical protein IWQ62_000960 [Dispira parvispora]
MSKLPESQRPMPILTQTILVKLDPFVTLEKFAQEVKTTAWDVWNAIHNQLEYCSQFSHLVPNALASEIREDCQNFCCYFLGHFRKQTN